MSFGARSQAGIKDVSSYGEAFVQADTLIPFKSESLTRGFKRYQSNALFGRSVRTSSDAGIPIISGDVQMNLDYAYPEILKYILGGAGAGTYSLDDDLPAFHLELDKTADQRWRFDNCKVTSATISAQSSTEEPINVAAQVVAQGAARSATAFPSLTPNDEPATFKHLHNGYIRIGDQADALGSGDDYAITSFEVTVNNNLQTDLEDTNDGEGIAEPVVNGFREIMLKVGIGRYRTTPVDALLDAFEADTPLQAAIYLDAGTGSTLLFKFPYLKITEGGNFNVAGPNAITGDFTFEAYYNGGRNSFMSVTNALEIDIT